MKAVSGMSVIMFLEVYLEIKAKLVDYQKIGQKKVVFMVYFKIKAHYWKLYIYLFLKIKACSVITSFLMMPSCGWTVQ